MAQDFRASQFRGAKFIASGSSAGGAKLVFYDISADSGVTPNQGTIDTAKFNTSSIGVDVFMYVSGTITSGSSTSRLTVFGGSVKTSGSLGFNNSTYIQAESNDLKFYDAVNPAGYSLSQLASSSGGGSSEQWVESSTSPRLRTTASVAIGSGSVFAQNIGSDVVFYVSGTLTGEEPAASSKLAILPDTLLSGGLVLMQSVNMTEPNIRFMTSGTVAGSKLIGKIHIDTLSLPTTGVFFVGNDGNNGVTVMGGGGITGLTGERIAFANDTGYVLSSVNSRDSVFSVSGVIGSKAAGTLGVAKFEGDVHISGNLTVDGSGGSGTTTWLDGGGQLKTTSSVAIDPNDGYASSFGTDVFFAVNPATDKTAYINRRLYISGALLVGQAHSVTGVDNFSVAIGGAFSTISHSYYSGIYGGVSNQINRLADSSAIVAGTSNQIVGNGRSVILGGTLNVISGTNRTDNIVLGSNWTITNESGTIAIGNTSGGSRLLVSASSGVRIGGQSIFVNGLSGSLTKLADGTSYLLAGTNVTITTGSNGAVTIGTSNTTSSNTTTTNATPATLWTLSMSASAVYDIDVSIVAVGTASNITKRFKRNLVGYTSGALASIMENTVFAPVLDISGSSAASGFDVGFTVAGTNLLTTVTGSASQNVKWTLSATWNYGGNL